MTIWNARAQNGIKEKRVGRNAAFLLQRKEIIMSNKVDRTKDWKEKREQELFLLQEKLENMADSYVDDPVDLVELFAFSSKFYKYSTRNTMLIYLQNQHATFVGSYTFFKKEGYSVRRGEKGLKIILPMRTEGFITDKGIFKKLKDATPEEKHAVESGKLTKKAYVNFKLGTVFDITQTNISREDYPKFYNPGYASLEHRKLAEIVESYIKDNICPVTSELFTGAGIFGAYYPSENKIQIAPDLSDTQRLSTLLHEMGHALMHREDNGLSRPHKEFQADAFSIMTFTKIGLDITPSQKRHLSVAYKKMLEDVNKSLKPEDATPEKAKAALRNALFTDLDVVYDKYSSHMKALDERVPVNILSPMQEFRQKEQTGQER